MKISTITFHNAANYGALMQAYSLNKFLENNGHDVKTINYKNDFIERGVKPIRFRLQKIYMYYMLNDIIGFKSRGIRIKNFRDFSKAMLNLTEMYTKKDLLEGKCEDFHLCISGSDQIWNPELSENKEVDSIYYNSFAKNSKRISYASSFGAYEFDNDKYNEEIYKNLSNLEYISVRESQGVKHLKHKLNLNAKHVLDPIFLLSKDEWKNNIIDKARNMEEEYILVYALTNIKDLTTLAKKISKRTGYKVIVISQEIFDKYRLGKDVHVELEATPYEFLNLLYNAKHVITNSFHGVAFSILFNKEFVPIVNPKSPQRVNSLFNIVGLDNVAIRSDKLDEFNENFVQIDYSLVNENLDKEIEKSKKFLLDSIENNK